MGDLTPTTPEPTTEPTQPPIQTATQPPIQTATQPPIQIDYIGAQLNITFNDKNFTEALNDPTSPEYQALVDEVIDLINGLLQNGYYADGNTTVVEFRPGSIVVVLVITFDALPDPLVVVLNDGGTDTLANVIGQELVSLLTDGLSDQNAAVELSDVVIEETTTTVETTVGTTTEATGPATPETTPESTPDTTPGTSPETSPDTSPATSPVTSPTTTLETTVASTTPELTCADDEFACDEGRCIDESAVCDFIPDCRVSRNDETEDLCEVSLLTEDISVTSRRNATLMAPDSYPSRTEDTPLDYILYRLTGPADSYLHIDVASLQSDGPDSIVTIGNGHDPVEAYYLPDGIFLSSQLNSAFPSTYYTPDNEAFVLLGRAPEEDVEINIRISVFQCPQEGAVPCLRSAECYLPDQICDDEIHCQNGEDELNCPNECASCTPLWGDDTPVCLRQDWVCDGYQDCDDNSDESDCPTCFECPSGSSYDCVFDPEWVCDTYEDCNEGEDERNCPVFCPDGDFGCPWPDSVCINETLICDFVPDCRVAGGDEAEEVCMVSQITDEVMVPFNEYKILRNPDSYPTRDVNTSSDYQLYKISSPPDSHLLIEIIRVTFDGTQSTVSVGSGLDPVQAFFSNNIVLAYTNGSGYVANPTPAYQTSPGNEAYILLEKAPEEGIEMLVRVSAFECESYNATPCSRSNHCYLEDEICDGTVQCERSGEDEQGCGSPVPDPCHYCERYGTDDTCLPQQWLCDDYADCIDGSDESDCGTATCFECPSGSRYDCVFDPGWVCDGVEDCNDGEDEIDCPDQCTGFVCETFFGNCLLEMYVCDGMPDCSDGTDELNCNATEPPCFQCPSEPDCIDPSYVCDGVDDCEDGFDEVNCTCPDDQYPCYFADSICLNYTAFGCDGNYDCPGGTDEFNCTGCFACPGSSSCLLDLQVCDFYNDCPYGEDEAEDLCRHSEYISNFDIQVGVWTYFSEGFVRERTLDDRDTPASEFYDFTHYVFESPEGSTLFMEILNFTMNLTGPLVDLVGVSTGAFTNPTDIWTVLAYADGYGNLESYTSSTNFTLLFNTGYLLIAMPKSVAGIFNMTFRVSAIECESPEFPCYLSLHCLDIDTDYCDGEVQCLDSEEDENGCEGCLNGLYPCFTDESCYNYTVYGCDGNYDCPGGTDEYNCTGCFACPGSSECLLDLQVCNYYNDCPDGEDEAEELCGHSEYISNNDIQVGVWTNFSEGFVRERTLDGRDTPASEFYDFTHYAFESPEGSTLFMEIQNLTINLTGPLLELVRVSAGYGTDPSFIESTLLYVNGYEYLESYSAKSTLMSNTGYLLIAIPKSVAGTFNLTFRVTAIECGSPDMPCIASLHCVDIDDYCDGEVQCLDSEEDEYGCEATEPPCFQCPSEPDCIDPSYVCDGSDDCEDGFDEVNCTTCFECPSGSFHDCVFDPGWVCDGVEDCIEGEDEMNCSATTPTTSSTISPDTSSPTSPTVSPDTSSPTSPTVSPDTSSPTSPTVSPDTSSPTSPTVSPDTSSPTSPTVSPVISSPTSSTVSPVISSPTSPTTTRIPSSTPTTTSTSPTDQCNEFLCRTVDPEYGNCISNDSVCDFITDCLDGSDEEDCDCFKCPNEDACLLDAFVCDFLVDCEPDGADEDFCKHSDYIRPRIVTTGEWITIEQRAGDPVEYRGTPASEIFYFYHYVFQADSGATLFVEVLDFTGTTDHSLDYHPIVTAGAGEDPLASLSEEAYFDTFGSVDSISSTKNFTLESSTGYVLLNFPKNTEVYVRFRVTAVACVDGDSTYCIGSPHCYDVVTECRDGTVQCLYTGEDEDEGTDCQGSPGPTTPTTSSTISPDTSSPTSPTTIPSSTPTTTSTSPSDQCNEFLCRTVNPEYGNCISNDSVCDFITDCLDGSDEEDCDCFKCPNEDACLLDAFVCDFLVDCEPDGADEDFCKHSDYIRPRIVTTGEWITIEQRAGDPVEYRGTPASEIFYFYHYVFQADSGATLFVEVLDFTGTADHSLDYHPIVTAGAGEDPLASLSEEAYFDTFGSVDSISSTKNFTLESSSGYVLLNFPKNTEAYVRFRVTAVACVDGDSTYCIGSPHCYDVVTECRDGTVQCLYTGEDEDEGTDCQGSPAP
ncbi:uncharacterized protein LOC121420125 [Lytechinus variegatus]|uniref:uncharacterized protein LOC121420125 n=1 Tax=Lytechinus variegatus TaxID=7654 RepID=UPI001BB0FD4B|nr:uncharacterized protein LOC121420125 [Lytechinus variegatus]